MFFFCADAEGMMKRTSSPYSTSAPPASSSAASAVAAAAAAETARRRSSIVQSKLPFPVSGFGGHDVGGVTTHDFLPPRVHSVGRTASVLEPHTSAASRKADRISLNTRIIRNSNRQT